MAYILFNKKHRKEYFTYGLIAGMWHVLTVWFFLHESDYYTTPVLFIGSILFMFTIMVYSIQLTKRKPEYKSSWMMMIAGHMAVITGIIVSVIGSFVLCLIYLPGFLNNTPQIPIIKNTGTLELIFLTATMENFGAGAFISAMIAFAIKPDQTKDQTPKIFEEPIKPETL